MTTKPHQLAHTVTPQVRDYVAAVLAELEEAHAQAISAMEQGHRAEHAELLIEMATVRANLATFKELFNHDPAHRITKAKLIMIATELGL
jgi:hypothetical protein